MQNVVFKMLRAFEKLTFVDFPRKTGWIDFFFLVFFLFWIFQSEFLNCKIVLKWFCCSSHGKFILPSSKRYSTFSESENRIIENERKMEQRRNSNGIVIRTMNAAKKQKGKPKFVFFYQGLLFGFVLIPQRRFRYLLLLLL